MKRLIFSSSLVFLTLIGLTQPVLAYVSSSGSYRLERDSINFSGGQSSSGSYIIESTAGEAATGKTNSGTFNNSAGYQQGGATPSPSPEPTPPPTPPGGGGGPIPVPGCIDPLATNYNSSATLNDGSCLYGEVVPNVTNFRAIYTAPTGPANITWVNPNFPALREVIIIKSQTPITSSTDGTIIYRGTGQTVADSAVVVGQTYFYAAFVVSQSNNYSSGAFTLLTISTNPNQPPPPPTDPFESFPDGVSTDPQIGGLHLPDFIFIQTNEPTKEFAEGALVAVNGGKDLTISIDYDRLPEVLKAIGITIIDPVTKTPYAYLLHVNANKTAYTATIPPFLKPGIYQVFIHVIDYRNQGVKRLEGRLQIVGNPPPTFTASLATKIGWPLGIAVGLAAGLLDLAFAGGQLSSLYDLYLLGLRGLIALLGFFGIRKKRPPWGTVYDAITKRPLDPAYVSVLDASGKEVGGAVTDLDGRYGFFLPAGVYHITAGKTHYQFPSQTLAGRQNDELYDNLYFGESLTTTPGQIINKNIPLDPIGFDWNEFVKNQAQYFRLYSQRDLWRQRLLTGVYYLGLGLSFLAAVLLPGWLNFGLLGSYAILYLFRSVRRAKHETARLVQANGDPLPFAIVRAFIPDLEHEIKSVVADALGRFYLLLPPGTYYLTVQEKTPAGGYSPVLKTAPMSLTKGFFAGQLNIPAPEPTLLSPDLSKS